MMTDLERAEIARLWARKTSQDSAGLSMAERHRNLHPASAELLCSLAAGIQAKHALEIGGSSGISTIALASAMQQTGGQLVSLEIEPTRQAESIRTLARLGLSAFVDFRLQDAATALPGIMEFDFVLIDCEKEDYIRFFDLLRLRPGALVVADNILSHQLSSYVTHVRALPGVQSMTLPIGQGLELTRIPEFGAQK